MRATVLGASGFVGGALARRLRAEGFDVATPGRAELAGLSGEAGHVFYCIGMTGDFRRFPRETVESQAALLGDLLSRLSFDSWLYLSSTRVHAPGSADTSEDAALSVRPGADSVYDLSKLLGEALCLARPEPTARVARLSNVYGPGQGAATFLGSVLRDLGAAGRATIGESPDSSKDYVALADVVDLLPRIALRGRERLYNVASGTQTTHRAIAERISAYPGLCCDFAPGGATRRFPEIDIARIRGEFGFAPRSILDDLPDLLERAAARKDAAT